ncbi:MAG: CPBP family intramembrane metalloprotease [Planctomycetes bacterium]|nr:CPBP family intramembrane metalloprotease [Planctomycetota bacterium]
MNQEPVNLSSAVSDLRRERGPLVVLAWAAVALTLCEYFLLPGAVFKLWPDFSRELAPGVDAGAWGLRRPGAQAPWWGVLWPWAWWSGGLVALWVLVPLAIARFQGLKPAQLGLGLAGAASKWRIYLLLLALVSPAVAWAATRESFTGTYPFLRPEYCQQWCWLVLLSYWGLYALQFFSVEFFFRGWMLFSLERRFGLGAIAVMVVPYCMIHYHKPLPEALGAIIAGIVLGWMAMKTRSIWGGLAVHLAVALGMDALSLARGGQLPTQFFP